MSKFKWGYRKEINKEFLIPDSFPKWNNEHIANFYDTLGIFGSQNMILHKQDSIFFTNILDSENKEIVAYIKWKITNVNQIDNKTEKVIQKSYFKIIEKEIYK